MIKMATIVVDNVADKNLSSNLEATVTTAAAAAAAAASDKGFLEYGLAMDDVYKLALTFYKEKEGKAVHFSYEDRLQLVAFAQQVSHGPLAVVAEKLPPLGALDVVGRDRRMAWQKLGQLSSQHAQMGFVELLSRRCSLFLTYVEAHRREKIEQEKLSQEELKRRKLEEEMLAKQMEAEKLVQAENMKQEAIKREIQHALNEQTFEQFRKYADEQFPGDTEKQGSLVRQLQEQHYKQYIYQLKAEQRSNQAATTNDESIDQEDSSQDNAVEKSNEYDAEKSVESNVVETSDTSGGAAVILAANMWTRSDIVTFKRSVSAAEGDGVVRVGHGETVTVRVPTNVDSSRLFWEFATDDYDIGFGVYFEHGAPLTNQVTVHVSDSEDDDDDDEEGDDNYCGGENDEDVVHHQQQAHRVGGGGKPVDIVDLENGAAVRNVRKTSASNTVNNYGQPYTVCEVIPVFRRDCQTEVYAGCHQYPGQGCYLLKFDNSYSVWRSKTLYYRVYYTK